MRMQNLFYDVGFLDRRCYEQFHLSEALLMEHAAKGMALYINEHCKDAVSVLIVCGSGNNGADGIALARLLHPRFEVRLYLHKEPSGESAQLQLARAKAVGIVPVEDLDEADVIVDALFGSGLNRDLDQKSSAVLEQLNCFGGLKIACDIPSGLNKEGHLQRHAFAADVTLSMGGLKRALYSDRAKESVGQVVCLELGIGREIYETASNWKLLDESDLQPPFRNKQNTHKGSFGHLSLVSGEKEGAVIISALSALHYGAGLVTLVGKTIDALPYALMQESSLPKTTTAIACGMGLGRNVLREHLSSILAQDLPMVLDADIFYHGIFYDLLHKEIIITPHPKEFVYILKTLRLADISVHDLQEKRFEYAELFCKSYPNIVLILKGANTIIAHQNRFYINPHGSSALAKGGSGDILTGLCGALLAQGYSAIDAAIQASLAQTLSAKAVQKNNYALLPEDIIKGLSWL